MNDFTNEMAFGITVQVLVIVSEEKKNEGEGGWQVAFPKATSEWT